MVSEIFLALPAPESYLRFVLSVARLAVFWPRVQLHKQSNWNRLKLRSSVSFRLLFFLLSSLPLFFSSFCPSVLCQSAFQSLGKIPDTLYLKVERLKFPVRSVHGFYGRNSTVEGTPGAADLNGSQEAERGGRSRGERYILPSHSSQ